MPLSFGRDKTQGNTTHSSSDTIPETIKGEDKVIDQFLFHTFFLLLSGSHHVQTYQASNSLRVWLSARDRNYRSQVRAPTRYPSQQITHYEMSRLRGDMQVGAGLQRLW